MSKENRQIHYREARVAIFKAITALNKLAEEMGECDGMACGGINMILAKARAVAHLLEHREDFDA